MLRLAPEIKVFLACQPVDMRRGFDGLSAEVARVLAADPFSGAAFVFRGKRGGCVEDYADLGRLRPVPVRQAAGERQVHLAADRRRRSAVDGGATGSAAGRHRLAPHGRAAADGSPSDRLSAASRHKNQATPRDCGCAGGAIVVGVVMSPSTTDSPRDPDDLRRLADDLQRDVAWLRAEVHAKALMIEKLRADSPSFVAPTTSAASRRSSMRKSSSSSS